VVLDARQSEHFPTANAWLSCVESNREGFLDRGRPISTPPGFHPDDTVLTRPAPRAESVVNDGEYLKERFGGNGRDRGRSAKRKSFPLAEGIEQMQAGEHIP